MKLLTIVSKLRFFGTYMLARFALLVPVTTVTFKRRSFTEIVQGQPKQQFRKWTASSKDNFRIINACVLAMQLVEKHSPFAGTCLSRSIVLWSTLIRYGFDAVLRIGVKFNKTEGTRNILPNTLTPAESVSFNAHAWVEINGKPLNAPQDITKTYTPFSERFLTKNIHKLTFSS